MIVHPRKDIHPHLTEYILSVGFWCAVFCIPIRTIYSLISLSNQSSLDLKALAAIATLLTLFCVGCSSKGVTRVVFLCAVAAVFIKFFILYSTSGEYWKYILVVAPLALGWSVGYIVMHRLSLKRFWAVGQVALTVNFFFIIIVWISGHANVISGDVYRYGGFSEHPSLLYPTALILAVISLDQYVKSQQADILSTSSFVCGLMTLAATGYRSGVVIFFVLSVYLLRVNSNVEIKKRVTIVLLSAGVLMLVLLLRYGSVRSKLSSDQSVDGRVLSGKFALDHLPQFLPFGAGPGQFEGFATTSRNGEVVQIFFTKAMSGYLHLVVEWGIAGVICAVLAGISIYKKKTLTGSLALPILALAMLSLFDVVVLHPLHASTTLLFGFILFVILRGNHSNYDV